jgi:hypothetical protein
MAIICWAAKNSLRGTHIFFLDISVLANNFLSLSVGQGSHERQRSDIICRTPVLIGGKAVRVHIRRLATEPPRTDAL